MRWGLSLLGMTGMPCCTWYLSSTWENVPSLVIQHSLPQNTRMQHTCCTSHRPEQGSAGASWRSPRPPGPPAACAGQRRLWTWTQMTERGGIILSGARFSRNASHFILREWRQFTWTVVSLVSQMGCRQSEQCSWICRTRSSPAAPCMDGVPPVEGTARSYMCTCEHCQINFTGSNFGSVTLSVQNTDKNFFL